MFCKITKNISIEQTYFQQFWNFLQMSAKTVKTAYSNKNRLWRFFQRRQVAFVKQKHTLPITNAIKFCMPNLIFWALIFCMFACMHAVVHDCMCAVLQFYICAIMQFYIYAFMQFYIYAFMQFYIYAIVHLCVYAILQFYRLSFFQRRNGCRDGWCGWILVDKIKNYKKVIDNHSNIKNYS